MKNENMVAAEWSDAIASVDWAIEVVRAIRAAGLGDLIIDNGCVA